MTRVLVRCAAAEPGVVPRRRDSSRERRLWRCVVWYGVVTCCVVPAAGAIAQELRDDSALPVPVGTVKDQEFGVTTHHVALQRRVWMWQWQATPAGVRAGWSERLLPSPDARHRNPASWPLPAGEWRASAVEVAGHPLSEAAIRTLGGWQVLRPSFDALPPNIAVTFQPEGDGLGSADDPQHPAIGDLHVAWREWRLLPLVGRVRLVSGRWQPIVAMASPPGPNAAAREGHGAWLAWIAGIGLLGVIGWRLRQRRRKND